MFQRRISLERLQHRLAFSVDSLLIVDFDISQMAVSSWIDSGMPGDTAPRHREIASVSEGTLHAVGLHPRGNLIEHRQVTLTMPANAVDVAIDTAIGSSAALGVADFSTGQTQSVLWVNAQTPIALGTGLALAGFQRSDGTVLIAYEATPSIRVAIVDAQGNERSAVTFNGEIYSRAEATAEGMLLLGMQNEEPRAAFVDNNLQILEIGLQAPASAFQVLPVGLATLDGQTAIVGSSIDANGETSGVAWDLSGAVIARDWPTGIVILDSSGSSLLADTPDGYAMIQTDPQLASALGITVGETVLSSQLASVQQQGWTETTITGLYQHSAELFVGIRGLDEFGQIINSVVVVSANYFPSHWQNQMEPDDVDQSLAVTPTDALRIINWLNSTLPRVLGADQLNSADRLDVNGDGLITASDALRVINRLNSRLGNSGSGESPSAACLDAFFLNYVEDRKKLHLL